MIKLAVTSIWAVNNRIDKVIDYVNNPEKTAGRPELLKEALAIRRALGDVIDYAENGDKTEKMMYVTGINCDKDHAVEDFLITKRRWHKEGGRLAYHGYQSFKEGDGEITAEEAHRIGVLLAKELWGDRFEVVVATHLNTGHYHNHFVINSVSFFDGLKYVRTNADYKRMQKVSDKLCRMHGLHVVDAPSVARGKSYDEWMAERAGKPTIRSMIREDIDYAIRMSYSEKSFVKTMKEMGYKFKSYKEDGVTELKHFGLQPPGAKSYFRFDGLGKGYDLDSIKERIFENTIVPGTPLLEEKKSYKQWSPPEHDIPGLPSTYRRYCIRLYTYISKPRKREYIPMALREDIAKLDDYIEQMDFLYGSRITNTEELTAMKNQLQLQLNMLIVQRKRLYSHKKKAVKDNKEYEIDRDKQGIRETSRKIREIRKKLKLCDEVFITSDRVLKNVDAPRVKPEEPMIKKKGKVRIR